MRKILQEYGFFGELRDLSPLQLTRNSGHIRSIYLVTLEGNLKIVCRISNEAHFPEKIVEQQCIFSEKLRENGIPVARKYKAKSGNYCIMFSVNSLMCCVTLEEYVGTEFKDVSLETFKMLGTLLGKMHFLSEHNPSEINYSTIGSAIRTDSARFSKLMVNSGLPIYNCSCIRELGAKHDALVLQLKRVLDDLPHGAVHGDMGVYNNLCIKNEIVSIIDFNLASDDPFLCDMFSCIYSSIYKNSQKCRLAGIDIDKAFCQFVLAYRSQRQLSNVEKNVYSTAAALFDGLYYCKAIIEEYSTTNDTSTLEQFNYAWTHFEPSSHEPPL